VAGKSQQGDFIDPEGRVLGRHKGIIHYTVGQRKGLGISLGERAFVTKIDPIKNTVTLSPTLPGETTVEITDVVYSGMPAPVEDTEVELEVKLRYTASPVRTVAQLHTDGTATLRLSAPQKFAPGQSAVLCRDGVVMLGGFIK
jgi:tRNA-specific 2-thiouridylase